MGSFFQFSIAATTRRSDFENVADVHFNLAYVPDFFDLAIHTQNAIGADLAGPTTGHTERTMASSI